MLIIAFAEELRSITHTIRSFAIATIVGTNIQLASLIHYAHECHALVVGNKLNIVNLRTSSASSSSFGNATHTVETLRLQLIGTRRKICQFLRHGKYSSIPLFCAVICIVTTHSRATRPSRIGIIITAKVCTSDKRCHSIRTAHGCSSHIRQNRLLGKKLPVATISNSSYSLNHIVTIVSEVCAILCNSVYTVAHLCEDKIFLGLVHIEIIAQVIIISRF